MELTLDGVMFFECDFDKDQDRWWFKDEFSGKTFYVSGKDAPSNAYDCSNAAYLLVNRELDKYYPDRNFFDIDTRMCSIICNSETNEQYPSHTFIVSVKYN